MGGKRAILEIGSRYGKLVIVSEAARNRHKHGRWLCLCDCGNSVTVRTCHLVHGNIKSCRCSWHPLKLDSYGTACKELYRGYKGGAKKRKYSFELTVEQFKVLTKGTCHYCGQEPATIRKPHPRNNRFVYKPTQLTSYTYNGIDRMNNAVGYTVDNCVTCCSRCNYFKGVMSYAEFIATVRSIAQFTQEIVL